MKAQSAKAKGRKLQQWFAEQIRTLFPALTERDVKSTPMGTHGPDVWLSEAAFKLFPYKIECKWRKTYKSVYEAYEQHPKEPGESVLIIKDNAKAPLAIISAAHFLELLGKSQDSGGRQQRADSDESTEGS